MDIKRNSEIKNLTTFKIGGECEYIAFPETINELVQLLTEEPNAIVLGSCSDVLVSSFGVKQKIIITSAINNFEFNKNYLTVQCGGKAPFLSKECQKRALSGFEFMIGFPGSFGGMVYMNASAHNQTVSDYFVKARVFDRKKKKIVEISKKDMNFGYRQSVLAENNGVLLEAEFELLPSSQEEVQNLMDRNIEFRRLRQPSLSTPNAGSIFKNPENDSAGRLLDMAGVKGMSSGNAEVWDKHANFIINTGNATSLDVLTLMFKMQTTVKEKYRINLVPEIKCICETETEEYELWKLIRNTQKTQK